MPLGYNAFVQEVEDASALALGRNGWIQPTEEQAAPVAAVVPASQVVASTREDEPLTQAGLAAAIAAGGDVYIGAGALSITATITIPANTRIFGAGVGVTVITIAAGVTFLNLGAFSLTLQDVTILGDATQKVINITAASDLMLSIHNVMIGTSTLNGVDVFIDGNNFGRRIKITDAEVWIDSAAGWFYDAAASGRLEMVNVTTQQNAAFDSGPEVMATNCRLTGGDASAYAASSRFSGCVLSSEVLTFGSSCDFAGCLISSDTTVTFGTANNISGCTINATTTTVIGVQNTVSATLISSNATVGASSKLSGCRFGGTVTFDSSCDVAGANVVGAVTAASDCKFSSCHLSSTVAPAAFVTFSACTIVGAMTVSGASVTVSGSLLDSFSSTDLNSHTIVGCTFSGAGSNVTLANSSSCVIKGNIACQVTESGTSNSNRYSDISTSSTIIGASSVVTDADRFAWSFPGTLDIASNADMARPSPQISTMVRLLEVNVVTAPTGAAITVAFKRGTKSTGVVGATIGTVTVAINAFTGSLAVSPAIVLASTEFIVAEVTQVGSTIAGAGATMTARA